MLKENEVAPDFILPMFGGGESHYYDAQAKMAVLIFYKFSCPTCQLALPFLQKIYDAYGDAFYFIAIAQDGPDKTAGFREEYKISIPTLMDLSPYPISNNYQISTVPCVLFVDANHKIRYASQGFVKQELLNLADLLAEKYGRRQIDVFGDAAVPEFKAG